MDSTVLLTNTGFEITLSGKIRNAAADVQAAARNIINTNTTFFLFNHVRKNVKDPLTPLSQVDVFKNIKVALTTNPNTIAVFISGMVYADGFQFRLRRSATANASANVIKIGDFDVKVDYQCEGSVRINAKQGGVFFKAALFRLGSDQGALVPTIVNVDFSKANLIHAEE